jgi:hypothetical protein
MNKKLENYLERPSRRYWHYYFLKRDNDFKKEAAELAQAITIQLDNGDLYLPTGIEDYDYLQDPNKDSKIMLINNFQIKWNIHWNYVLLNYLLRGDEDDLPPKGNGMVGVSFDKDRNMFTAQIPRSVQREDLDVMWRIIQGWKRELGIDISKRPRKNTFTEQKSKLAYQMWKMLRAKKSWTEIVQFIDKEFDYHFEDISTAQKFLKANGYYFKW